LHAFGSLHFLRASFFVGAGFGFGFGAAGAGVPGSSFRALLSST
jgi:hypothetical protein